MGAIAYEFEGVPEAGFAHVYTDLCEAGWALPTAGVEEITRGDLVRHLQAIAGAAIGAVLARNPGGAYDPAALHAHPETDVDEYGGRIDLPLCVDDPTDCAHAQIFSTHRTVIKGDQTQELPSHLTICLRRLPHGPNALTAADIRGAKS